MFANRATIVVCCLLLSLAASAQEEQSISDTTHAINTVTIKGYINPSLLLTATNAAVSIDSALLQSFSGSSLVPIFNTAPGVRMEERSPGSYRLSLRGSLLRSPFGVRNVKVYFNQFPLTDAGGNSYLNAIPLQSIGGIEILKGPDGSLFGANSGGVVMLNADDNIDGRSRNFGLTVGSFGLFNQSLQWKQPIGKHILTIKQSYQQLSGYRDHSAQKQLFAYIDDKWKYSTTNELRITALYSNLRYQTPGGLTADQYAEYPTAARFPTAQLPGAKAQKAAIYSKMFLAGISHTAQFSLKLRHFISLSANSVDFKNPFITNYETRSEKNAALRSYLSYGDTVARRIKLNYTAGFEGQTMSNYIANYDNIKGEKGDLQAKDKINTTQYFFFGQIKFSLDKKLFAEVSASINTTHVNFNNGELKKDFRPQLMPRIAISYLVHKNISLRALASKGYSTPTTAEIRPSDNQIYDALHAEYGWNFELGFRTVLLRKRLWIDVSAFNYQLEDAIVRRQHSNGTEYFINAGGTIQNGLEAQINAIIVPRRNHYFIRHLQVNNSYTLSSFYFDDYIVNSDDFSGNDLTGVPRHVVVTNLAIGFPANISFFAQHNFTDKIPLNDANAIYANSYHLVQLKANWKIALSANTCLNVFGGFDNLLNQKYSLGNDLNAAGARYFNAAPPINYFGGLQIHF